MAGTTSVATTKRYREAASPAGLVEYGERISLTWTADASDGTVPNTSVTFSGWIVRVITNPGATAPTDDYDITVNDPDDSSFDIMGGALADRDTANTEQVYPVISGAATPVLAMGAHTVKISGNSVNSATGVIHFDVVY